VAPPRASIAPSARQAEAIDGAGVKVPTHADDLGRALDRHGAVLASLRVAVGEARSGEVAPRAVEIEWDELLEVLDGYLDGPAQRYRAMILVRARIALESELEADRRAWRLPGGLEDRVRSRVAWLGQLVERLEGESVLPPAIGPVRFLWPVEPVVLNSPFGWRSDPIAGERTRFHHGVDLDGDKGQVVGSAAGGVVTWAGWNGGHGRQIEVTHHSGWVTRYSHLSRTLVTRGDRVGMGDPVGLVGSTGRSTGPHLHFELWKDGRSIDPMAVLGDPVLQGMGRQRVGGP